MSALHIGSIAREACSSIAKHYFDPIHSADRGNEHSERPYFDEVEEGPLPELSPFCLVWYDTLLDAAKNSHIDAAREVLCCYSVVQLRIKENIKYSGCDIADINRNATNAMIMVFHNFELMISHLLSAMPADLEKRQSGEYILLTGTAIHVIADDIVFWATNLPSDRDALLKVQNFVLPYLLRLLEHSLVLLGKLEACESSEQMKWREVLAFVVVVIVPFVGGGAPFSIESLLKMIIYDGSIKDSTCSSSPFSLAHTIQSCWLPESSFDNTLISSDFFTRDVVDWSASSALLQSTWSDDITGTGQRIAMKLLSMLYKNVSSESLNDAVSQMERSEIRIVMLVQGIGKVVGMEKLAAATRAFFYNRQAFPLSTSNESKSITSPHIGPLMPMIQRITSESRQKANGGFSEIAGSCPSNKMRITSAAIVFCAVLRRTCESTCLEKTCSDAIPVALSLLNDAKPVNQAIGAIFVISVLKASAKSTSVVHIHKFHAMIMGSLRTAIRHCGENDAVVFAVLCLAQSQGFALLHKHSLIGTKELHSAAMDLFDIILKQTRASRKDDGDIRLAVALVAGINPILGLLLIFPEAAAVEVCRPGLSALLPLLGLDGMNLETRAIQIAALCSILSLIKGACPIISHHPCKIMTGAYVLLHRLEEDIKFLNETVQDDGNATAIARNQALYLAAAILAVSDKAETVLQYIASEHNSKHHIQRCDEIRSLSLDLASALY